MPGGTIVVFEKQPRWGPELQRQFLEDDVSVRTCGVIRDVPPLLETDAAALLVMDVEGAAAECLQLLGAAGRPASRRPTLLIGSRQSAELEWAFRELGALDFVPDDASGAQLARLCRRQLSVNISSG